MATILTSLQKVITGVGPGYRDFILLRGRKCILEPQKKFVQAKVSLPYFIKQKLYSYFKTATRLRVRNKGKARLEQRMPILRIRSKNLNNMKQWFSTFRKRDLPNFYTGQGIRYPTDIVMNRDAHTLKWKERKNKKRMKSGKRRKKKLYAYILTIK